MKTDILEVQPHELKFLFELKKQSSCSVQLFNRTDSHVAFKVKTTNPKKYCVRPNTGVIDPNSACDFSVTMQAQKVAPPDMICKDKFLVQSTAVPAGTKEEDVTSNTFHKEDGKFVDEKRLKVIIIPLSDSPESSPINETSKQLQHDEGRELKDDLLQKHSSHAKANEDMELSKGDGRSVETTLKEESMQRKEEAVKTKEESVKTNEESVKPKEESMQRKEEAVKTKEESVKTNEESVKPSKEFIIKKEESMQMNDIEELKLAKDVEEMKLKVKALESKLNEAKAIILHLTEEKRLVAQEKHFLQGELDLLRSKRHRAQVGFPLLFVFIVALVSLYLGYLLHH